MILYVLPSFPWKRESSLFNILLDTRLRGYDNFYNIEDFFNSLFHFALLDLRIQ